MRKARRGYRRNKKIKKSRFLIINRQRVIWIVTFVVLSIFLYLLFFGELFSVKVISCERENDGCSQEIMAEVNQLKGKSILTFKRSLLTEKLKNADPTISKISIKTHLPDEIDIKIKNRGTVVGLSISGSDVVFLVDDQGYIFKKESLQDTIIPIIIIDRGIEASIGDQLETEEILNAISLAKSLNTNFISYKTISIKNRRLTIKINDQIIAIFSMFRENGNYDKEVTSLQQILSQATIDSKPITIDLRFKKPVLKIEETGK